MLVPAFGFLVDGGCTVVYVCAARMTAYIFALEEGVFRAVGTYFFNFIVRLIRLELSGESETFSTAAATGSAECTRYHIVAPTIM